jgi:uncharacterized protein YeaO (DUF488 family)
MPSDLNGYQTLMKITPIHDLNKEYENALKKWGRLQTDSELSLTQEDLEKFDQLKNENKKQDLINFVKNHTEFGCTVLSASYVPAAVRRK